MFVQLHKDFNGKRFHQLENDASRLTSTADGKRFATPSRLFRHTVWALKKLKIVFPQNSVYLDLLKSQLILPSEVLTPNI